VRVLACALRIAESAALVVGRSHQKRKRELRLAFSTNEVRSAECSRALRSRFLRGFGGAAPARCARAPVSRVTALRLTKKTTGGTRVRCALPPPAFYGNKSTQMIFLSKLKL
jgi:hypothetical protein